MIQLGQIVYDSNRNTINLELSSMVEDNLSNTEQMQLNQCWSNIASAIDNAMQRQAKEMIKCK